MARSSSKSGGKTGSGASAIWGGRYAAGPAAIMEEINASVGFDQRMAMEDIQGSLAHVAMLGAQGIVSKADANAITKGLQAIREEISCGKFTFKRSLEDVHMNVESRLADLIGPAAGRLHTARSRNDQVATDIRLWLRGALDALDAAVKDLQAALIDRAEAEAATVMPGFTHLQSAQPVTLGHHLLAYVEMLGRDRGRLMDCRKRLNECPLGAAALAGTSFPIDRNATAKALGFDRPTANSLDSVADRDFALEFLAAGTILGVHLSRFAEELVIWCSQQFAFARFSDAFSTGSSIMPQKRNPDAAELVRAKVGRVAGAFQGLVIVMKGLPMTYGKDMQEDKEPVFDAADTLALAVAAMAGMVRDLSFDRDRLAGEANKGFSTATDLADWLVRVAGLPFRQAHHVTGTLVRRAEQKGCGLEDLTLAEMREVDPKITKDVYSVLGVAKSVASRTSLGGTAPKNVRAAAKAARRRFLK